MSLGQITKQLAKEALGNQVKDVIDSLRPQDAAARAESAGAPASQSAAQPDNLASVIVGQVQAMQNSLKEDQELVVMCAIGLETLRVFEFFSPSPRVLVLTGIDTERNLTRVISPADALQLICKPMAVQTGSKPARIKFVIPKPKPD